MGIDITMQMGYGFHIPKKTFNKWLDLNDPDEEGGWDVLERLLESDYPELTFSWPGNSWIGEDHGWVIFARASLKSYDMGREAEAGVYRPTRAKLTLDAHRQLEEVSVVITGERLPVEWLVTVGVS
jgi:hypothetical protein